MLGVLRHLRLLWAQLCQHTRLPFWFCSIIHNTTSRKHCLMDTMQLLEHHPSQPPPDKKNREQGTQSDSCQGHRLLPEGFPGARFHGFHLHCPSHPLLHHQQTECEKTALAGHMDIAAQRAGRTGMHSLHANQSQHA